MKQTRKPEYPTQPRTADNYRLVKKTSIAGVSFLENRGSVMASTNVGDTLRLVREPDNSHDPNAIRIDRNGGQKLGYIPRTETADFIDKMDAGIIYTGIITSLQRHEYKIEADIYERMQIPFPDFTSFSLKTYGFFSPVTVCSFNLRERKFTYKEQSQPHCDGYHCVELKFSTDYWEKALTSIQQFNFPAWEKYYDNPMVLDGTQWKITIRRRNGKPIKISGSNAYPEEWEILQNFIYDCLDLKELKGNGRFYIQAPTAKSNLIRNQPQKLFSQSQGTGLFDVPSSYSADKFKKLCDYIPYFEQQVGKKVRWSENKTIDGVMILPYPICDAEVSAFHKLIYDCGTDKNYSETIKQYDFDPNSSDFSQADLTLIQALLTFFVRGEHFCDGFMAEGIESGWILGLLKRLDEIRTQGE